MKKKNKQKQKDIDLKYPHNPDYSMIYPDSEKRDDDSVSTSNES